MREYSSIGNNGMSVDSEPRMHVKLEPSFRGPSGLTLEHVRGSRFYSTLPASHPCFRTRMAFSGFSITALHLRQAERLSEKYAASQVGTWKNARSEVSCLKNTSCPSLQAPKTTDVALVETGTSSLFARHWSQVCKWQQTCHGPRTWGTVQTTLRKNSNQPTLRLAV